MSYRESSNAAAMRSAQAAYDNAAPDDEPAQDDEHDNTCPLCGIEIGASERHRCPDED